MSLFIKDTLSEAQKGAKLVKELLAGLTFNQIQDEGESYNLSVKRAFLTSCNLLQDIETCQNASVQKLNLNGKGK